MQSGQSMNGSLNIDLLFNERSLDTTGSTEPSTEKSCQPFVQTSSMHMRRIPVDSNTHRKQLAFRKNSYQYQIAEFLRQQYELSRLENNGRDLNLFMKRRTRERIANTNVFRSPAWFLESKDATSRNRNDEPYQ